jgi:hypothetical protein
MAQDAGKSHGFGRVGPVTRPSPYSPVQFRGRGPVGSGPLATDAGSVVPRSLARRSAMRRAVAGLALAAVAAAGAVYFTLS